METRTIPLSSKARVTETAYNELVSEGSDRIKLKRISVDFNSLWVKRKISGKLKKGKDGAEGVVIRLPDTHTRATSVWSWVKHGQRLFLAELA